MIQLDFLAVLAQWPALLRGAVVRAPGAVPDTRAIRGDIARNRGGGASQSRSNRAARIAISQPAQNFLAFHEGQPQCALERHARLHAAGLPEQPLHRFGRTTNGGGRMHMTSTCAHPLLQFQTISRGQSASRPNP